MIKEASKEITDSEVDQIDSIVNELRTNFLDNRTQDLTFRKSMLQNIVRGMEELEKEFTKALHDDMRIDETTAYLTNILLMKNDAIECASHLSEWYWPLIQVQT
jgi:acyl-CoA reductase-like NAD-dependent aldehyde dehydrogenase